MFLRGLKYSFKTHMITLYENVYIRYFKINYSCNILHYSNVMVQTFFCFQTRRCYHDTRSQTPIFSLPFLLVFNRVFQRQ